MILHYGLGSWVEVKPSSGPQRILNGNSPLKAKQSPLPGLIPVCDSSQVLFFYCY